MFCERCGKQVDETAQFCSACGRPVSTSAVAATAGQRLDSHLRVMAVLWVVYSGFRILMGAWTLAFSHYFLPIVWNFMPSDLKNFPILDMLHGIYVVTFLYALAAGIAGIVAAWSLQQRKPWGRTMALIIAFISMINIPFGTALGVYTVIVLLPSAAGQDYQRLAVPA